MILIFTMLFVNVNYGQAPVKRQTQQSNVQASKPSNSPRKSSKPSSSLRSEVQIGQEVVQDVVTYKETSLVDKTLELSKAKKSITQCRIPSQVNVNGVNYSVTSIGETALRFQLL